MSRNLALLRRPAAVAAASALLLAGGADAALAASQQAPAQQRIYACVTSDFKTLNLTTRGGRCDDGQQKISWAIEGPRGATGPRGPRGATGAKGETGAKGAKGDAGATGATGAKGETGATGPQGPAGPAGSGGSGSGQPGPAGPAGPQGPIGLTGPVGPIGPAGPAGADGDDGATGPIGPQGVQGTPGATLATASSPASVTTRAGGLTSDVTALPLSGVRASALTYTDGNTPPFLANQVVAAPVTFTRLLIEGRLTQALALVGTTVNPHVALVVNNVPTSLACDTNALTGVLVIGTSISALCTGSVTLSATDSAHVAVSATATGLSLINTVSADVQVALG